MRLPFSTSTSWTSSPFELVHCDVWTSHVHSVSDYSYYLVMMDDFTQYCWMFPLHHKSDVPEPVHFICGDSVQSSGKVLSDK